MAFREVRVFEVREVLRLWLRGEGCGASSEGEPARLSCGQPQCQENTGNTGMQVCRMYAEGEGGAGGGRTSQTSWTVFAHVTDLAGQPGCALDGRVFPGGQEVESSNLSSPTRKSWSQAWS
jgi:hypothetical protein